MSEDVRGISRLCANAVVSASEVSEELHMKILSHGGPLIAPIATVTSWVYSSVRWTTRAVDGAIDFALPAEKDPTSDRGMALSVLNGIVGDHLDTDSNPLTLQMEFRRNGSALNLEAITIPNPVSGKILVFVHGLCSDDQTWGMFQGYHHGTSLEESLGATAVYLRYNTGRHISTNGHEFASLLHTLVRAWPTPIAEVMIVAHSMGGLVTRAALDYLPCRYVTKCVFLGSPHHGSPLERWGHWFQSLAESMEFTAPIARLGRVRSCGITDLRHGSVSDADWVGKDRFDDGLPLPLPLPLGIRCYAVAASLGAGNIGDGLVSVDSALGRHEEAARCLLFADHHVVPNTNHLGLLCNATALDKMRQWLSQDFFLDCE